MESSPIEQPFTTISSVCGRIILLGQYITDIKVVFYGSKLDEFSSSVVPRFLLNLFCSLDSCASFCGLIRTKMILMISLHTVDPMLSPLYLPFSLPGSFMSRITANGKNTEV